MTWYLPVRSSADPLQAAVDSLVATSYDSKATFYSPSHIVGLKHSLCPLFLETWMDTTDGHLAFEILCVWLFPTHYSAATPRKEFLGWNKLERSEEGNCDELNDLKCKSKRMRA